MHDLVFWHYNDISTVLVTHSVKFFAIQIYGIYTWHNLRPDHATESSELKPFLNSRIFICSKFCSIVLFTAFKISLIDLIVCACNGLIFRINRRYHNTIINMAYNQFKLMSLKLSYICSNCSRNLYFWLNCNIVLFSGRRKIKILDF